MSSVLFLDIVEYSKKSVSGQISLKDRFNTYLSEAIHDVPVTDRIILDTGDGAAVNFLGDVESALSAALRLRESLLAEDPSMQPELLVRIGINLGPVRLVRDINGQPNIVGDGINVAQRVMGFADPSQILVSRSYYDAVSRLSPEYTGMFHYQGSRTDKHVREHEIYAIGYPGDQTTKRVPAHAGSEVWAHRYAQVLESAKAGSASLMATMAALPERVKQADSRQRVIYYSAMVVAPLLVLFGALALMPSHKVDMPDAPASIETNAMPSASVADKIDSHAAGPSGTAASDMATSDKAASGKSSQDKKSAQTVASAKQKSDQTPASKTSTPSKFSESRTQNKAASETTKKSTTAQAGSVAEPAVIESYLAVSCKDDTQVFVDSAQKGKVSGGSLSVTVSPGKHKVILTHPSFGIYTDDVEVDPGKTGRVRPKVCN